MQIAMQAAMQTSYIAKFYTTQAVIWKIKKNCLKI